MVHESKSGTRECLRFTKKKKKFPKPTQSVFLETISTKLHWRKFRTTLSHLICPSKSSSPHLPTLHRIYQLRVRQQPLHARMCGFGEKDRRPIDPPPIIQLIITDEKGNQDTKWVFILFFVWVNLWLGFSSHHDGIVRLLIDVMSTTSYSFEIKSLTNSPSLPSLSMLQNPFFVLHVTLWSEDRMEERNIISNPPKCTRVLMGSLVSSPSLLKDTDNEQGLFFAFPDLSIRTEGRYTLKFSLMKLRR